MKLTDGARDRSRDEDLLETLARASTATLASQLLKRGLRNQFLNGVSPLWPAGGSFAGPAMTLRCIPAREDIDGLLPGATPRSGLSLFEVAESVEAGHVLVIGTGGQTLAATGGDILLCRMQQRGVSAVVTDGAFRDTPAVAGLGFPAYAAGSTANVSRAFLHTADMGLPIGCAGVAVYPGDLIVGDEEGVIVVPREMAQDIAEQAADQEQLEEFVMSLVREGHHLSGVYPPGPDTLEAYRRWQNGV